MTCPNCGNKHHEKTFGLVRCGKCWSNGRVAQFDRVAKSKGVRQNNTRPDMPSMRAGTNRGGLDN